jgi:hypothetical protein
MPDRIPFSSRWIRIPLLNLLIVSFLGIILRYKIAFSLPFIQQKNLLHGHSHFAFSGWVTQILMYLLIRQLKHDTVLNIEKKYKWLLYANLFTAFGMLVSFPIEGYGPFAIVFSTLSVFVSYVFAIIFWKDLNKQSAKKIADLWFKAAVFFNAFSSLGAFGLAFIMILKIILQQWSLAAVYFFLHFQYNGWFFFACVGLLVAVIENQIVNRIFLKRIFFLFLTTCIPAYFLSVLWLPLPLPIFLFIAAAAVLQLLAWIMLANWFIKRRNHFIEIPLFSKRLFVFSAVAISLKLVLQLVSTIPALSQLVFGFRPIVIGYLHLVLLGVITIFILSYITAFELTAISSSLKTGITIFVAGIILNEILLTLQGITDLAYIGLPFINEMLLIAAVVLFTGLLKMNLALNRKITRQ